MTNPSFGEEVRLFRQTKQLSQEELAAQLGVSFATVNRWENSRTQPSAMALKVWNDFKEQNTDD